MLKLIDKSIHIAALISAIIGCICLVGMVLMIVTEVIIRPMGHSLLMVDEYSGYMVLAVLGFGWAYAFRRNVLLKIEIVFDVLPIHVKRILTGIYGVVSLAYCLVITGYLGVFAYTTFTRGIFAPTPIATPLFYPQALVPLGGVLVCLVALNRIINPASALDEENQTKLEERMT